VTGRRDLPPPDCAALYASGAHYDAHHRHYREDVPFYRRLAREWGDPVLELACGTGRLTLQLAEDGRRITGLDVSPSMLEQARLKARARGLDVELVAGDCREFDLGTRFRLIFIPFNSFSHLHDRDAIEACLDCARRHLEPDGRFLVDVFNPSLDILRRDPDRRYKVIEYPDPDGGGTVVVTESNTYDAATQINRIRWYYHLGESMWVVENNMRIFYPEELWTLLEAAGFRIDRRWGDYERSPFGPDSPKQLVLVAQR
jgi:SAM-dependent methyltransferase